MIYQKVPKPFVLSALVGAIVMASMEDSTLAYIGITYYIICFIAVLICRRRAIPNLLLWSAVGIHTILVSYSLWKVYWYHSMLFLYRRGRMCFVSSCDLF